MCDSAGEHQKEFGDGVICVVNLTEVDDTVWTTYIGRANSYYGLDESVFANPYTVDEYGREEAVRLYELWLFRQLYRDDAFYESFTGLVGETVACWCLPKLCHGEVLASAVVAYSEDSLDEYVAERFGKLAASLFGHPDAKEETRTVLENAGVVTVEPT